MVEEQETPDIEIEVVLKTSWTVTKKELESLNALPDRHLVEDIVEWIREEIHNGDFDIQEVSAKMPDGSSNPLRWDDWRKKTEE